jgi:hypothetical protein
LVKDGRKLTIGQKITFLKCHFDFMEWCEECRISALFSPRRCIQAFDPSNFHYVFDCCIPCRKLIKNNESNLGNCQVTCSPY